MNMGGQKPEIGANWPLTGPYLQPWSQREIANVIADGIYSLISGIEKQIINFLFSIFS